MTHHHVMTHNSMNIIYNKRMNLTLVSYFLKNNVRLEIVREPLLRVRIDNEFVTFSRMVAVRHCKSLFLYII